MQVLATHMAGLQGLEERHLESTLAGYLEAARGLRRSDGIDVAMAAALIEIGLERQRLGHDDPDPLEVLVSDLCLARASRLLAHSAEPPLQIAFARVIEEAAARAARGAEPAPVHQRLLVAIEAAE